MVNFAKPYILADHVEWMVASGSRSEVSRGDLLMDAQVSDGLDPDDGEDSSDISTTASSKHQLRLDDCFDHLEYRTRLFGSRYLFAVQNEILVKRNPAPSSDESLVYTFLLACSCNDSHGALAMAFTDLCKEALSRLFGSRSTVYNIDAGSKDRSKLGKNTKDMAKALAQCLGCSVIDEHVDALSGQGDGGADLIAAFNLEDGAKGHLTFLGQCAASADEAYWKDKIHQPRRFAGLYSWIHQPALATFVPVLYRSGNGGWINPVNVMDSVFFDRLRILSALRLEKEPLPDALRDQLEVALKKGKASKPTAMRKRAAKKK